MEDQNNSHHQPSQIIRPINSAINSPAWLRSYMVPEPGREGAEFSYFQAKAGFAVPWRDVASSRI